MLSASLFKRNWKNDRAIRRGRFLMKREDQEFLKSEYLKFYPSPPLNPFSILLFIDFKKNIRLFLLSINQSFLPVTIAKKTENFRLPPKRPKSGTWASRVPKRCPKASILEVFLVPLSGPVGTVIFDAPL